MAKTLVSPILRGRALSAACTVAFMGTSRASPFLLSRTCSVPVLKSTSLQQSARISPLRRPVCRARSTIGFRLGGTKSQESLEFVLGDVALPLVVQFELLHLPGRAAFEFAPFHCLVERRLEALKLAVDLPVFALLLALGPPLLNQVGVMSDSNFVPQRVLNRSRISLSRSGERFVEEWTFRKCFTKSLKSVVS